MSKKSIFYTTADLNYSDVSPTLDLNFVENQKVPPFVNVTRNSQTTYVDKFGILRTANINQPVFEWDPITGKCLGARIWGAVTNLFLQSNSIGVSPWGTNNAGSVTYTSNAALSPAGVVNARRITATADFAGPNQFASVTSGTTYTASFFVKAVTSSLDELRLELFGYQLIFKISTQVFFQVNVNFTAYGVINYGNGWYRLYASAAAPSTGSLAASLYAYQSADVYAWGAQFQAGTLGPYVPTTTTAASSTADVWSITGADFSRIWNQSEGSVYAEIFAASNQTNGVAYGAADTFDNTLYSAPDFTFYRSGASLSAQLAVPLSATATTKIATAFRLNDFAAISGNNAISTDASGAVPVSPVRFTIGCAPWFLGSNMLNGYIRRLTIYPKRLTDSQLKALTR